MQGLPNYKFPVIADVPMILQLSLSLSFYTYIHTCIHTYIHTLHYYIAYIHTYIYMYISLSLCVTFIFARGFLIGVPSLMTSKRCNFQGTHCQRTNSAISA